MCEPVSGVSCGMCFESSRSVEQRHLFRAGADEYVLGVPADLESNSASAALNTQSAQPSHTSSDAPPNSPKPAELHPMAPSDGAKGASASRCLPADRSWEHMQREMRVGELLVPLFHCLTIGADEPGEQMGEGGGACGGGTPEGAKRLLRLTAVKLLTGDCSAMGNADATGLVWSYA